MKSKVCLWAVLVAALSLSAFAGAKEEVEGNDKDAKSSLFGAKDVDKEEDADKEKGKKGKDDVKLVDEEKKELDADKAPEAEELADNLNGNKENEPVDGDEEKDKDKDKLGENKGSKDKK